MSEIINSNAAAGQRASKLTFGIELECVAIVPKRIAKQYGSIEQYVRSHLSNSQVKLPCTCEKEEHLRYLPIHDNEDDTTNDYWTLTNDMTVDMSAKQIGNDLIGSDYASLELISRVQKFEGTSSCPLSQKCPVTKEPLQWTWREEIKCFLDLLHEAFSEPGFCLLVNETTGFHVHLGQGDEGLPVNVVQGLLGAMTALERSFDQILPTYRISGSTGGTVPGMWSPNQHNPLPGVQVDGFHALYKPGLVDTEQDFDNRWCPAMSKTMIQHVHNQIWCKAKNIEPRKLQFTAPQNSPTGAAAADPVPAISAQTFKSIEQCLASFNVPSWLNFIKNASNIQELKDISSQDKYVALSLRGLGDRKNPNGPPTAEVRTHAGSLDFDEICAWVDLLCSIARWAEIVPKEGVFAYLLESWKNAEYNISDLATKVEASHSTFAHYSFVLADSSYPYVQHRFDTYTSPPLTFTDKLENLNRINEERRRKDFSRANVDEKIRWKLESGRYGQLHTSFLQAQPEPELFSRPEARFLHYTEESQKAWAEFLKDYYRVHRKVELSCKEPVDVSGAVSDDSSDSSSDTCSEISSGGVSVGDVEANVASDAESVAAGADDEEPGSISNDETHSDDSDDSEKSDDKSEAPIKSPVESLTDDESEDDFNREGWYGIHPMLANAYNDVPGQHLTHLEKTVISMPALPSPTTPNTVAFDELKTDTVLRIHNAISGAISIEALTAADMQDDVDNIIARAVESTKQMYVLKSVAMEKAIAKRHLKKKVSKE
ncbi:unnamed protein product [Aureobasidium uvarum]|uniref:Amidoligase enzyme-domain-containing protein n=1 Tax=Aureobasidium uvarum TaxID=2773716 RepID=A0A9N8KI59_9PEZI|nr:unnamed protein product [Aureobasidium uvarum]